MWRSASSSRLRSTWWGWSATEVTISDTWPESIRETMKGYLSDSRYSGTGSVATPKIDVLTEGREVRTLVGTGCTTTIVQADLMHEWTGNTSIKVFDGRDLKCRGVSNSCLNIRGRLLRTETIVVEQLVPGIEAIIGMDVICRLWWGGVMVDRRGAGKFAGEYSAMSTTSKVASRGKCELDRCQLDDKDFFAKFNDGK